MCKGLDLDGVEWASHIAWDFLKRKIKMHCEGLDKKHRARKRVITKKALGVLKVKDDSEDAIKMKLDAIETLKEEQQKAIQNIKAASEFNRIRDTGGKSEKEFPIRA